MSVDKEYTSWGLIVERINRNLSAEPKSLPALAEAAELNECTVRSFLPFTNAEESVHLGRPAFIEGKAKKVNNRQKLLLILEVSKRFYDKEWMNVGEVKETIKSLYPAQAKDVEVMTNQLSQLYREGKLMRRGMAKSYEYAIADSTQRTMSTAASMSDQLIAIATKVEQMEQRNVELEKENAQLKRKLSRIKGEL